MDSIKFLDPAGQVAIMSKTGAIVMASTYMPDQTANANTVYGADAKVVPVGGYNKNGLDKVAHWGSNNLKPLWILQMLSQSHINAQLIYTKVSLAVAQMYTFKWELSEDPRTGMLQPRKVPFDPGPEIRQMLNHSKAKNLVRARATDYFITGNTWAKFILHRDPARGIADIIHVDASTARCELEEPKTKQVQAHYVCSDWRNPKFKKANENGTYELVPDPTVRRYPAFDPANPARFYQSIHHSRMYWTGEPYYGIQPWHNAFNWIGYGNQMPIWLLANIQKAYNIKYHIQYPDDYFSYLNEMFDTDEKRIAEKKRVLQELDDSLAGAENAQKTIKTPFKTDPMTGKVAAEWKITPIQNDLKDEAFIKAFYASQIASVSSQGLDPALASIQFEGRMPISGSDKRISYQLHEVLKNDEVRQIMVEPFEILRDSRGWDPEMQFGFIGRNIVTLAEDASGATANQIM